ncbi:hypothetical protein ASE95_06050 [Sphingomonas sp. Leaf231]|nr:hypothetical protein ASE95_06050 [Sphingomonas sp. Leaf231]
MRRVIAGGYAAQGAQGLYLLEHEPGRLMDAGIVAPACNVSAGVAGIDGERWFFVDEMTGTLLLYDSAQGWREIARVASGAANPVTSPWTTRVAGLPSRITAVARPHRFGWTQTACRARHPRCTSITAMVP